MLVRSMSLAAICAVFHCLPAGAHHSHGNYDVAKWTTMDGTVKELHLLVPHSWLYLDVKDHEGRGDDLGPRSHRPGGLTKVGVKREDVGRATPSRSGAICCGTVPTAACSDSSRRCTAIRRAVMGSRRIGTVTAVRAIPRPPPWRRQSDGGCRQ